ncbi:HIG1 domain family member 1A, mitochondrial-like [Trichoplusia ni]|uniref:HIG1 domain family member 1A, mitochondrial-like n=1 Tax=Trichoplusia ni TaxID=7111 RepID=A0A7E5VDJ9_TRINI|nr:HIG1 domain family member 1A, mitochondrial-like [Trichoplusia ni]XP_026726374.1 HIG1 domain family member 1A, mitochondrial-like [Trichoplusia ni]XP_026726375.1 HIG1 domain family member 1A, mitochondrial-like [Trichoplusia ni]
MAQEKPVFDYHEESQSEKLARKTKESPFMILGIAGCLGSVAYGAYAYKNRGAMSTSVFLMQFRVIAQGTAVGALCAGMAYTLYNNHFNKPKENLAILPKPNEH